MEKYIKRSMRSLSSQNAVESKLIKSETKDMTNETEVRVDFVTQTELILTKSLRDKENLGSPPRRRSSRLAGNTRSMAEEDIMGTFDTGKKSSPEKKLPFVKYTGEIKYFTKVQEIAESSDTIMQWIDKQTTLDFVPVSFDMEWPFSFQTGPGKASVIQICVQEQCCWVFHLTNLKILPPALRVLLQHPKIRFYGSNIKNDFRKLARDFPEVNADELVDKCIDLSVWYNRIYETSGRRSLEVLANVVVEKGMDKSRKIRMSQWHVVPLNEDQLMYAAIDVYIGLLILHELQKLENTKLQNEKEFLEKNGELAFKAIKALGETFLNKREDWTI